MVAFHSRKLNDTETRYSTCERELLSVVDATRVWRHYLMGKRFQLYTDNKANSYIQTQPHLNARRMARWVEKLQEYDIEFDHVEGKNNVVADALSRRADYALGVIMAVKPSEEFFVQLRRDAGKDAEYQRTLTAVEKQTRTDFSVRDGLVYHHSQGATQLYVPAGELREKVLCEAHDVRTSGHLGRDKTLERLKRQYYWPQMGRDVHTYVRTCPMCQKCKAGNAKPIGLLHPLPIPEKPWDEVSMDLIVQLPTCKESGYDAVVTFVDRLTKMVHLVPTTVKITAEELATTFFDTVFRHHGMPKVVVSDRDSKFTSRFWRALFKLTGTKLAMSTAYHPQTDGQTERANRTVEEMLRAYVSPHHDDWDKHLVAVEFAYNSAVQASTGFTPFYLNHGHHPHTPSSLQSSSTIASQDVDADAFAKRLAQDLASAKENLAKAQERQSSYANTKRRAYKFTAGDKVMLSHKFLDHHAFTRNIRGVKAKFNPKQWGPFEVVEAVGPNATRLKLPEAWKMHDVINNSYLAPYRDGAGMYPGRSEPPPDPEVIAGEEHFRVEQLLNHRWFNNYLQFFVRYSGHTAADDEWQFAADLQEDMDTRTYGRLVEEYRVRVDLPKSFVDAPPPLPARAAPPEVAYPEL